MLDLNTPLSRVLRGKAVVTKLSHLGVDTLGELLWYPPRRMYRWGELTRFDHLHPGTEVTLFAVVMTSTLGWTKRHDKAMLTVTLRDQLEDPSTPGLLGNSGGYATRGHTLTVRFFAKHPGALSFHAQRLEKGTLAVFAGKLSGSPTGREAFLAHPEYQVLQDWDPEEAQSLATRPQPLYHATAGLPSWKIAKLIDAQLLALDAKDVPEVLPLNVREKYHLLDAYQALQYLHHPYNDAQYHQALDYLRFTEALTLGAALAKTRQLATQRLAWALDPDPHGGISRFRQELPFALTAGQVKAWQEISGDMAKDTPMNRLLQGEVGSGKTVIAALAGVSALLNGHQAALMAPTEVLATQHFATLGQLLGAKLGDSLFLLTGSTSAKEKAELSTRLEAGEPLFVVGTHALVTKGLRLNNLGVAIVDEQHRFGVEQRMALAASGEHSPHFLAMSATPIPRTVAMTVFGDLDVSTLVELPKGRQPIQTFLVSEGNTAWVSRAWRRAGEEIAAGGRVYVLCPKISADSGEDEASALPSGQSENSMSWDSEQLEDLSEERVLHSVEETAARLQGLPDFADIPIAQLHSALDAATKQRVMSDFASGKTPLLVCTTVVEVGMDVPQATMMIILDADRFGLSQLHQLRGRIGRGSKAGVCLAIAPLDFPSTPAPTPNPALTPTTGPRPGTETGDLDGETQSRDEAQALWRGLEDFPPALARLSAFAATRNGFTLAEADLLIRREGNVLGDSQSGRKSALQVLSLARDAEVISQAKTEAALLVRDDPQLSQHPELARRVFALGQGAQNLTKS